MLWFKALLKKPFGMVRINDHYYVGSEVSINGNKIYLDGVEQAETVTQRTVQVAVSGNVEQLHTVSGRVVVDGEVGNINTTSGDVSCKSVAESVTTVSGDIVCTIVYGDVRTVSGDITRK